MRVLPAGSPEPNGPGSKERQQEVDRKLREKDFYDLIFGQGDYAPAVPMQSSEPEVGTGDSGGNELFDPYSVTGFKR